MSVGFINWYLRRQVMNRRGKWRLRKYKGKRCNSSWWETGRGPKTRIFYGYLRNNRCQHGRDG